MYPSNSKPRVHNRSVQPLHRSYDTSRSSLKPVLKTSRNLRLRNDFDTLELEDELDQIQKTIDLMTDDRPNDLTEDENEVVDTYI